MCIRDSKEGDPLPSVRNVAAEYRVNPLTVLKSYQQLVDEQLVESKSCLLYTSHARRNVLMHVGIFDANVRGTAAFLLPGCGTPGFRHLRCGPRCGGRIRFRLEQRGQRLVKRVASLREDHALSLIHISSGSNSASWLKLCAAASRSYVPGETPRPST